MPLAPANGRIATTSTKIPMPPRRWVSARHSRMPLGTLSRIGMTDAPVVVRPDTVSNSAAIGEAIVPDSMYGTAPAMLAKSQPNVTTPSPSRRESSWSFRVRIHSTTATASVPPADWPSAIQACDGSPYENETRPQAPIRRPTTPSSQAITWNTGLKFIAGGPQAVNSGSILDTASGRQ